MLQSYKQRVRKNLIFTTRDNDFDCLRDGYTKLSALIFDLSLKIHGRRTSREMPSRLFEMIIDPRVVRHITHERQTEFNSKFFLVKTARIVKGCPDLIITEGSNQFCHLFMISFTITI